MIGRPCWSGCGACGRAAALPWSAATGAACHRLEAQMAQTDPSVACSTASTRKWSKMSSKSWLNFLQDSI